MNLRKDDCDLITITNPDAIKFSEIVALCTCVFVADINSDLPKPAISRFYFAPALTEPARLCAQVDLQLRDRWDRTIWGYDWKIVGALSVLWVTFVLPIILNTIVVAVD